MIYVLNKDGKSLIPTNRYGRVRHLLKDNKAKVVKKCPFTIKLLYYSTNYTQAISLGIDSGSKHIGLSATTQTKELYSADVGLRTDIVDLISTCRQNRRNRKTRYRKPRFLNRISSKKDGWLAPSIKQKIDCHLNVVDKVCRILPITNIVVETASFDIQKIKNPDISGSQYQQGDQLGFWNIREYVLFRDAHICQLREYVLFRDAHICQCCKGKSKDKILNIHHNKVGLLVIYHIDARCISGNPKAEALGCYYYQKKVRCHNRQIHKISIIKGGIRKRNQADYTVYGFRLFDKVSYDNKECFIFGKRRTGYFDLRTLDNTHVHKSASWKNSN